MKAKDRKLIETIVSDLVKSDNPTDKIELPHPNTQIWLERDWQDSEEFYVVHNHMTYYATVRVHAERKAVEICPARSTFLEGNTYQFAHKIAKQVLKLLSARLGDEFTFTDRTKVKPSKPQRNTTQARRCWRRMGKP